MADWRNGNRGGAARLNDLVTALRDVGLQPGDFIPIKAWTRVELVAFGVVDPAHLRAYRRALEALDVVEQVGGHQRSLPIKGFRVKQLPTEPLLPLAAGS